MALTQAALEADILNWLSNQQDYTTKTLSAQAFADMYYNFTTNATADSKPIDLASCDKTKISDQIIALPDTGSNGDAFAEAVDQGLVDYWTGITFDSGDISVANGTPPSYGPLGDDLKASFPANMSPTTTKEDVAASMAAILFTSIGTIEALVNDPPHDYSVPII
jgi:hypothetical protein